MANQQKPQPKQKKQVRRHDLTTGRRSILDKDIQDIIIQAIQDGAYDYQAAEAAGVADRTFRQWMQWGEKAEEDGIEEDLFRKFAEAVRQARAQARVQAERTVFEIDPFKWLRYGPGRERAGRPGWTDEVQVTGAQSGPVDMVIRTVWGRGADKRQHAEHSEADDSSRSDSDSFMDDQ